MFEKIMDWLKGAFNMFTKDTLKNKLGIEAAISSEMVSALDVWSRMYQNEADWLNDNVKSMNLPASVAGELANLTTIELSVTVEGDGKRAEYMQAQIDKVLPKLRAMIEFGNAKGGLMMKPFQNGKSIDVDYVQADQFLPVAFDVNGNITACVFIDRRTIGNTFYTRLEWHEFNSSASQVVIKNLAYKSTNASEIGRQVELGAYDAWAGLQPIATINNVTAPLYGYYRFPMANNIDPQSPFGVSCYSRAVDLIQQADELWSNLLWEFDSGKRAIFADVLAFDRDDEGRAILPDKRLYRALANSTNSIGEDGFFHEFSPEFREASILSGLDAVLKKIEYNCGLAYGTISDPQVESKTATEIKISRQRTYATIKSMQNALEDALDQVIYAMDIWATLYKLAPAGKYSIVYEFDDSIVVDKEIQFMQDMRLVQAGLISKVEFRMRNFGENEEVARQKLAEVQTESPEENLFAGA